MARLELTPKTEPLTLDVLDIDHTILAIHHQRNRIKEFLNSAEAATMRDGYLYHNTDTLDRLDRIEKFLQELRNILNEEDSE